MPKFLRHVQFPPHPPAIPTPLRHTHNPLSGAQEGHGSRGLIPLMHTIKSFQTIFFFNENKLNPSTKWKRCFSHMFLLWCKIYLKQYYIITVWQHLFQTWHQEKIINSICSKDNQKKKTPTWQQMTLSSSWVSQEKTPHILEVLNSVSHKTDSQCERQRTQKNID